MHGFDSRPGLQRRSSSYNGAMASYDRNRWNESNIRTIIESVTSKRQALRKLGLREAGGNYSQLSRYIEKYAINTAHFSGRGWSKGKIIPRTPILDLSEILIKGSTFQSNKLKYRLFAAGLKKPLCEECGWCTQSIDGRLPIELDHINGDRNDNRLENLRILCPNCHSLKPTHRGSNIRRRRGGEIGIHATLKTL